MKDLSHYLIDSTVFYDHILKKYDIDIADLEEYRIELLEHPSIQELQQRIPMDIALYLYLVDSCENHVKNHFYMYFNRHLIKSNLVDKHVLTKDEIMTSVPLLLCFMYTVQYYFL